MALLGASAAMALFFVASTAIADGAAAPQPSTAQDSNNTILPDPSIRRGVLPNGLRYAIKHNTTPAGAVSIRLGIDAGTFEEGENEHGVAHFVEHMAFNAGHSEHEEGPEKAFAAAGAEFGRDQNAETETFKTVYRLDLPHGDDPSLDLAFRWFHDIVRQPSFPDTVVDRERRIVLAERDARRDSELHATEALHRFLAPGLRSTRPNAIGTAKEIRDISAERLQAFYRRWYRPDNAMLVVVGDAPVEVIERRIQQAFADWQSTGEMPAKPRPGSIDAGRGLVVQTIADAHLPTELNICAVHAASPQDHDDVARLRKKALTALWLKILNVRLAKLAKSSAPPFFNAEAVQSDESREFEDVCVAASPLDENWQAALRAVENELRRLQAYEPTQDELDDAVDFARASYRGGMQTAGARRSSDLATTILDKTFRGEVVASPVEAFRAFDMAVEGVTPTDVRTAFNSDWAAAGPLISFIAPNPPPASALRRAWSDNQGQSLAAPAARAAAPSLSWGYSDFGPAGHVAKRESFQSPEFTRLTFANGVVLNFKHTAFEQGMTKVRVTFGAGRREIANRDYIAATMGAEFFKIGGVGRHDYQDIQQMFSGWSWDAALKIGDSAFVLDGDTTSNGLKTQLQILAAYMSDPGFRSDLNARLPSAVDAFYRQYRAKPALVLGSAITDAVAPGSALSMPPIAVMSRLRMNDFERILKPALISAPLEITIVGDVDEATATELVGETFGEFPPRQQTPRERPDTFFLRFPDHEPPTIRVMHDGPPDQAMVEALWQLYVAEPERRREEVSLLLLSHVFDNALRHRVRQELGKSYAPAVSLYTPDHGDQGYMDADVEAAPRDIDQLLVETRRVAELLSQGNFTDDDIEAARKPMLADMGARANTNDWWLNGLSGSSRDSDGLDQMRDLLGLIASVSAAEIRAAAAKWLAQTPLTAIALPQAKSSSTASSEP
jgi:zinc protease